MPRCAAKAYLLNFNCFDEAGPVMNCALLLSVWSPLKRFHVVFQAFHTIKVQFFWHSVQCGMHSVHHGIKHFVFKSKMANSITVLIVEPYSWPSSTLFQFSWGKIWSKTIHNSQSFHAAVKTLSYGMCYLHFGNGVCKQFLTKPFKNIKVW